MPREIVVAAPVPSLRRRVRLAKLTRMLLKDGYAVRHLAWERAPGEVIDGKWEPTGPVTVKTLLHGGGYANRRVRVLYILWAIQVFLAVLRLPKGTVCFCLGWETAFPALIASYISRARIVFDDADRFSMFVSLPRPVASLVRRLERWTSDHCVIHIVPGLLQYEWRNDKMFLLRNAAMGEDYSSARCSDRKRPDHKLVLYMNGWIANDTGVGAVTHALRQLDKRGVDYLLYVAGKVVATDGADLMRNPRVKYLGELPQRVALEYYTVTDLVITLYDPVVTINRYAGSNKWADCIAMSTPFVVNREVESAADFLASGAAFGFEYSNFDELGDLFLALAGNPSLITEAKKKFLQHRHYAEPYEKQYEGLRSRINFDA
jgi:hypothetical protein